MPGHIEFYTLCAILVKEATKKDMVLPTKPDTDDEYTKLFFSQIGKGLGVKKDIRPRIVEHWNQTRDEEEGKSRISQRDGIVGTY